MSVKEEFVFGFLNQKIFTDWLQSLLKDFLTNIY